VHRLGKTANFRTAASDGTDRPFLTPDSERRQILVADERMVIFVGREIVVYPEAAPSHARGQPASGHRDD
jgi:hypothetical protein